MDRSSSVPKARAQSLRTVQLIYAALAFGALVLGLVFRHLVDGLPEPDKQAIAFAFLAVAAADLLMMFLWERLSSR